MTSIPIPTTTATTTTVEGSRKVKPGGKTNMDLLEQEIVSGNGIIWAICKSARCFRQISTPESYHSVFTGRMPFLPLNQQRQSKFIHERASE